MRFVQRLLLLGAAYVLVCAGVYLAGFRVYRVPTAAMEPVIRNGEYVFGRLSEGYRAKIARFDVVLYSGTFQGNEHLYVKRVVGLPGERVTVSAEGVAINGAPLVLPPTVNRDGLAKRAADVTLPADAVFVLGDNTAHSLDSRFHGPTPLADVKGRLVFTP